jgi:gamma-glutamylcyclotransferase (GGCT)/AIG2-like uncharacterized protein YtfP
MSFLFAYGSLRAAANHTAINELVARLRPIGGGQLPGHLYYLGRYPGAIFAETAAATVAGEVLELADDALLAELDAYEAYDPRRPDAGEYLRRQLTVEVAGGGVIECWVYELRRIPRNAILIDGGDYVAWLQEQQA